MTSTVTLGGNTVEVSGSLPQKGHRAPAFSLVSKDIANVTLSTMRGREFLDTYGVALKTGPLAGIAAHAVVVLDENNVVLHSQMAPEIKNEPDYAAALTALG